MCHIRILKVHILGLFFTPCQKDNSHLDNSLWQAILRNACENVLKLQKMQAADTVARILLADMTPHSPGARRINGAALLPER